VHLLNLPQAGLFFLLTNLMLPSVCNLRRQQQQLMEVGDTVTSSLVSSSSTPEREKQTQFEVGSKPMQ